MKLKLISDEMNRQLRIFTATYLLKARDQDPSYAGNSFPQEQVQEQYARRAEHLWMAAAYAARAGIPVGIRQDPPLRPGEDSWPVLYFELPTGQVSWHMMPHPHRWDGHETAEKYERIDEWAQLTDQQIRGHMADQPE